MSKILAIVLNSRIREGVAKATQKPYKFYVGQAYVPVAGLIDFTSNSPVPASLSFDKKSVSLVEIDLERSEEGKFTVQSVGS